MRTRIKYAIATILAMGLLAVAWPAEAEVVYTPTNITIGPNSSYNLDLNNDGVTDFVISTSVQAELPNDCFLPTFIFSVSEVPASGNGTEGSPPAALSEGDQIGPSQTFYAGQGTLRSDHQVAGMKHLECHLYNIYYGDWKPGYHYLGLALQVNGETYYGWAKLKVVVNGSTARAKLLGYAYESSPDTPINAGQTK
jgi:hypothetical protein